MKFTPLENEAQLQEIHHAKGHHAILKHNTTCPISKGVQARLELEAANIPGLEKAYLLDLLQYRHLSDAIAAKFGVPHQSPQFLLIRDGRCIYHEWGYDISAEAAAEAVAT